MKDREEIMATLLMLTESAEKAVIENEGDKLLACIRDGMILALMWVLCGVDVNVN